MVEEQLGLKPHDLGGKHAGTVDIDTHDPAHWERRVDALMMLLSRHKLIKVDELRRAVEALGAEAYLSMGYYERWIAAMTNLMLEKGVVSIDELGRRMEAIDERTAAEGGPR